MRADDDLPIFRPKMGTKPRASSNGGVKSFRNAILSSVARVGRTSRAPGRASCGAFDDGRRRVRRAPGHCQGAPGEDIAAQRQGGGAPPRVHSSATVSRGMAPKASSDSAEGSVNRSDFAVPLDGEKHQFRLIVSPEDAAELNLTDFVRRYMDRVERDLGRKLEWAAVNHFDTDHPHAHIIVRGVDRDGRGFASIASTSPTVCASARRNWRPRNSAAARGRGETPADAEVSQDRLTSLDKELARRAEGRPVDVTAPQRKRRPHIDEAAAHGAARAPRAAPPRRANFPDDVGARAGWQDQLRELGMRGDIIKQMHRSLRGDPSRYRVVLPGRPLDTEGGNERAVVYGRVAQKGRSDELKGSYSLCLRRQRAKAFTFRWIVARPSYSAMATSSRLAQRHDTIVWGRIVPVRRVQRANAPNAIATGAREQPWLLIQRATGAAKYRMDPQLHKLTKAKINISERSGNSQHRTT